MQNQTAFRINIIKTYFKKNLQSKWDLAENLYLLLKKYELNHALNSFKSSYPNNKVRAKNRKNITRKFEIFIKRLNKNRNAIICVPTFKMVYYFSKYSFEVSLRTYKNILKSNNIYVLSCKANIKKKNRKRIKFSKDKQQIINMDIIDDLEKWKATRIYKGKRCHFGLSIQLDVCEHAWIQDEKFHIYKAIDSFTGKVIETNTEKEETGKGYVSILGQILSKLISQD